MQTLQVPLSVFDICCKLTMTMTILRTLQGIETINIQVNQYIDVPMSVFENSQ